MVPCQAGGWPLNLAQRVTSFTWSDSTEGRVPVVVRTQSVRLQGFAARQDPLRVKNSSDVSSRTPAPGRTRSTKIIVRVLQGQESFQQSFPCNVFLTWRGRPSRGGMTRPASPLSCPPDNPEAQLGSRNWRRGPATDSTGCGPPPRMRPSGCHHTSVFSQKSTLD